MGRELSGVKYIHSPDAVSHVVLWHLTDKPRQRVQGFGTVVCPLEGWKKVNHLGVCACGRGTCVDRWCCVIVGRMEGMQKKI